MDTNEHQWPKFVAERGSFSNCRLCDRGPHTLGHGLVEKPYENALVVEFLLRRIPFQQQPSFDVLYKGQKIGLFVPDLIAFNSLVVDTKVIDQITDHERGLMLNYLLITSMRVGVILNFRHSKLEWQRIAL